MATAEGGCLNVVFAATGQCSGMYYLSVRELPESVLAYIRRQELLKAGDRVGAAVSAGADSVAMLRIFLELRKELGIVLSVVHFNHKLRGDESDADQRFVAELAEHHKLEFHLGSGEVTAYAAQNHLSIEAGARKLRYEYFRSLFERGILSRIATGHTLDDQAETVLLRLVRGAGIRGLAGIYPRLSVGSSRFSEGPAVIRPLLATQRGALEEYLVAVGQEWREDSSNRDLRFARNRLRHGILPRLGRYLNPEVRNCLAETAEIAREEEEYWQREISSLLPQICHADKTVNLSILKTLPLAVQRRIVRAVAATSGLNLEFCHVEEVLNVAFGDRESGTDLPGGWTASRRKNRLHFDPTTDSVEISYEYRLTVPGEVEIPELGTVLEAARILIGNDPSGYNPEHLFEPALLPQELIVRNWRPGDRFWPAHSKSPKKVKELLQAHHVKGPMRQRWPVVANRDEVVWLRGFPAPAHLRPGKGKKDAIWIRERPAKEAHATL